MAAAGRPAAAPGAGGGGAAALLAAAAGLVARRRRIAGALRALAVAAAALLLPCAAAGAATATGGDVDAVTFRALAQRAADDPGARAELLAVDSVEGRPVDVRRALAGAQGDELRRRLELLAGAGAEAATPARLDARAEAREILADDRFRRREPPRPLRGVVVWIGERLEPLVRAIGRLADRVPGGGVTLWAVAGATVVLAAAALALALGRRRAARVLAGGGRRGAAAPPDPARLEREADEAERRGDHERALRLRFRAGLLRLDELDVIGFRESLATAEVARRLRSDAFDRLAAGFDEVVYGRRPARADDARLARECWGRVLQEAARR